MVLVREFRTDMNCMTEKMSRSTGFRNNVLTLFRLLLFLLPTVTAPAAPLPTLNIDLKQTSASGVSSGGYMALQFAIAHSDIMLGSAIFGGGPYRCGAEGVTTALGTCMQGQPDPQKAIVETETAAANGLIAATDNILRHRVWLFAGYNDGVVKQSVMDSLYAYVTHYVPSAHVFYQKTLGAGHAMITQHHGTECSLTGGAFINDCDYDGAGLLLQHIYGKLSDPAAAAPAGELLAFEQSAFTQGDSHRVGLAREGYLYLPASCSRGELCRVHIAFHGCRQYAGEVNDQFYRYAGYNQWADNNRIIVLYPQTVATSLGPFNPKGCWDWWGYTGSDFAYRNGAQIGAVRSMLDHLAQGFTPEQPLFTDTPPELSAIDATDDSALLVWTRGRPASAYRLYRAPGNTDQFERVADMPQTSGSHVDRGLLPDTKYSYRIGFTGSSGTEEYSNTATIVTRSPAPDCDPYFNDNVTHASRGRAHVWFGLTFAKGSWDYMGFWNLLTETALLRDDDGFQVGVCPWRNGH